MCYVKFGNKRHDLDDILSDMTILVTFDINRRIIFVNIR